MLRLLASLSLLIFAAHQLIGVSLASEPNLANAYSTEWKAGVGRACITPVRPMPMSGYAARGATHATGTLHDLWVKSLVLEDSTGHRALLVTLDLCGIDRELADRICTTLEQRFKFERQQVMLATSHTHSGPVVAGNLRPLHYMLLTTQDQKLVDEYAEFLIEQITTSVEAAVKNLQPSSLAYSEGSETFAVNRRANPEKDVPALRAENKLAGPSDHSVPILVVSQADAPVAIVFGYACHCTTLSGMEWSGDYAGIAQAEIEKAIPGCTALFWAGCGADQNPIPRRAVEFAVDYGQRLATAVRSAMKEKLTPLKSTLRTELTTVAVPLSELPTREQIENNCDSTNQYEAARARELLRQLNSGQALASTYQYPIATWRLGDAVDWVALGGEVVVDYAISIKALPASRRVTWVTAYANDVMAYIPSRRVLAEGGYEGGGAMVYYGLPTTWAPEIESTILNEVARQLASP